MSCIYCGGDYCGSSVGGPSMCENSPTYEETLRGNKMKWFAEKEGTIHEKWMYDNYHVYRSCGGWNVEFVEKDEEFPDEWNYVGNFPTIERAKKVVEFIEESKVRDKRQTTEDNK